VNAVPEGLDADRAVQVLADRASGRGLGSGYLVSADLVLTAAHVVAGAQALTVRFVQGPGRIREVPAHAVWAHGPVDLAVLRLERAAPASAAAVRFGRLGGAAACGAVGYPWFKLRARDAAADGADPGVFRDSHHARGTGSPLSNRRTGALEVAVAAPSAHPDPGRSAWEGMSGAAVFAGGCLVGVVSENYGSEGPGWLTARPVTAWYPDPPEDHFTTLHTLLALPPAARLTAVGTAAGPRGPGPRQLPPDTALFTGRGPELDRLLALADEAGAGNSPGTVVISAIDGMGGVGKTALAVRAGHRLAERYPDGQLFLDLYGHAPGTGPRTPADALATVLAGLGVPPQQMPADLAALAAFYRDRLAGTRTLLVLDNAADEDQIRPLLPATDTCLVLVTSRRRLKALDDALPLPLDVLSPDEAVTLLAGAARLDHHPDTAPLLEQAAQLCGHLPLALVIAGALLRTGGKAWNLTLLIDRLAARRPGNELAGYTDGQRRLDTVFDLSYHHLPEPAQRLYRRLGLLPGPEIDTYAAAALLDTDPHTADGLLQHLADHSLLIGSNPGRYRPHDLIRAHARTQATTRDPQSDRENALDRLLHYYAHTAHTASRSIARHPRPAPDVQAPAFAPALSDPEAARTWLRTEHPNLDAAHTRARTQHLDEHTVALAAGMADILFTDGPWPRALEIHQAATAAAARWDHPAARATALNDLGRVRYITGDYPAAVDAHTQALEIYRQIGNRLGEATALNNLGQVRDLTGDYPAAVDAHTRALEIFRQIGNRNGEATTLTNLGQVRAGIGDYSASADAHTQALEIYRQIGHSLGEANALTNLGRVRYMTGDCPAAAEAHAQALVIFREIGHRQGEAIALSNLGQVRHATGDYPAAVDAHAQALVIFHEIGHHQGEATALNNLGQVQCAAGDYSAAADAQAQALVIFREIGHRLGEANALSTLGQVLCAAGEYSAAADAHAQALEIYRQMGHRSNEAWALNHYAATIAAGGDHPRALALYQQALAMNRELNKPDDEAISLEGIADHHLATGDPDRGTAYLHEALGIYQRLGMRADIERVQARLAELEGQ
jgi:tetratricopeptide (TPR) repeat protein